MLDIEIIEIAVNPDHVHFFFRYPPKHSLSYIAKQIKGRTGKILRENSPPQRMVRRPLMGAPSCYHGSVGSGWYAVEQYIQTQDKHHAKREHTRNEEQLKGCLNKHKTK